VGIFERSLSKRPIQRYRDRRFERLVRNGTTIFRDGQQHVADQTLAAMQEMERYCAAHPGSPAAVRCPGLSTRGRTFVALLGPTIEECIAGFGDSVQAFDAQYSRSLARSANRD
jgi:hypothetical protein